MLRHRTFYLLLLVAIPIPFVSSSASCVDEICGYGLRSPNEECPEGKTSVSVAGTNCLSECAACGDGFLEGVEECDDGNLDPSDECNSNCRISFCGDGFVQKGEQCDIGPGCDEKCQRLPILEVNGYCARLYDESVKCWGDSAFGQLGYGSFTDIGDDPGEMGEALPTVSLSTGLAVTGIYSGGQVACASLSTGALKCWGDNTYGQLGQSDKEARGDDVGEMGNFLAPIKLGTDLFATAVSVGSAHVCAVLNDETAKCWGRNDMGQLGLGTTEDMGDGGGEMDDALPAIDFGAGYTPVAVAAGDLHTCGLFSNGKVKCWGAALNGELGSGDVLTLGDEAGEMGASLLPIDLGAGVEVAEISAGLAHTCVLAKDGRVKCWGRNDKGQLGLGDTNNRGDEPGEMGDNLPFVDLGGKEVVQISAGGHSTCARFVDDSMKCWGDNSQGELGLGDTDPRGAEPGTMGSALPAVDVGVGLKVVFISRSEQRTCAILADASLKCWGDNSNGQLGLGDLENRGDGPNEMGDKLPIVHLYSYAW